MALNMHGVLAARICDAVPIRERNLSAEFEHFHPHDAARAAQRLTHEHGEGVLGSRCYWIFQIMPLD
jgi:hypothetical protein